MPISGTMESSTMIEFTETELLDAIEQRYVFKHTDGSLKDFRCLTYKDGEVYIEYRVGHKQFNHWVTLNDPNIYMKIFAEDILDEVMMDFNLGKEVDWGQPVGTEFDW
jgi:hypothetical protein